MKTKTMFLNVGTHKFDPPYINAQHHFFSRVSTTYRSSFTIQNAANQPAAGAPTDSASSSWSSFCSIAEQINLQEANTSKAPLHSKLLLWHVTTR
jgi:hypothetical protein